MGWLLFAVFLTGTVAFFRHEITYWMTPELHQSVPSEKTPEVAAQFLSRVAPQAEQWRIDLPDERDRTVSVMWRNPGEPPAGRRGGHREILDAATGETLHPRETRGGGFLYRFHFELYAMPRHWGRGIVGVATLFMFVAILSGIVTHKKIFADFFTFRPKKGQRSWLDAHAATAVLALPFHLMITFSGLVLVASTLLFWNYEPRGQRGGPGENVAPAAAQEVVRELPLPLLAPLIAEAEADWGQPVGSINIDNPFQRDMRIELTSLYTQILSAHGGGSGNGTDKLIFDASGTRVGASGLTQNISGIQIFSNALGTLHRARYADSLTRWLFFIAGVLGTIMVGTGMVLWSVKRARKRLGRFGYELVCGLNVGSIAGLMAAMGIYFWANRLVPATVEHRADWEVNAFFVAWAVLLVYGLVDRHRRGWVVQLVAGAVLYLLLPVLNFLTSDLTVLQAWRGHNWPVLGFDGISLLTGVTLAAMAGYLYRKPMLRGGKASRAPRAERRLQEAEA